MPEQISAPTPQPALGRGPALPVGRVGEAEDVASAYLYLMANPHATGSIVTVDGGTLLV